MMEFPVFEVGPFVPAINGAILKQVWREAAYERPLGWVMNNLKRLLDHENGNPEVVHFIRKRDEQFESAVSQLSTRKAITVFRHLEMNQSVARVSAETRECFEALINSGDLTSEKILTRIRSIDPLLADVIELPLQPRWNAAFCETAIFLYGLIHLQMCADMKRCEAGFA